MDSADYFARCAELRSNLARLPSLAVAFSGGVDSAVLLHAAVEALGDRALGVIADSPSLPRAELVQARALAEAIGARLEVVATGEFADPRYTANTPERCYFCKQALFEAMRAVARREGIAALAFGEITDDARDDRPGARAAREARILAPLADAGMGKAEVRRYAREAGLPVWDKPAAACLASRLPTGTPVDAARLARIEEAEARVRALGLALVRVRDHGRRARLEVGSSELQLARSLAPRLGAALAAAGFESWELAAYVPPGERASAAGSEQEA